MPSKVEKSCHAERSGKESEAILPAQSKHPYRPARLSAPQSLNSRDASTPNGRHDREPFFPGRTRSLETSSTQTLQCDAEGAWRNRADNF